MKAAAFRAAAGQWLGIYSAQRENSGQVADLRSLELGTYFPESLCVADMVRFRFFLTLHRPCWWERLMAVIRRLVGIHRRDRHPRFDLTNTTTGTHAVDLLVPVWKDGHETSVTIEPPLTGKLSALRIRVPG